MNKLKLLAFSSLLISSTATIAAPACSGFQIKLQNNTKDNFVFKNIELQHAKITPSGLQKLDSKTEQIFLVQDSQDGLPMTGEFNLISLSIPYKKVKIRYTLENKLMSCIHTPIDAKSDFPVRKSRELNQVVYTISP